MEAPPQQEEYSPEQLDKIVTKFNPNNLEGWEAFFSDFGFKCYRRIKEGTTYKYRTYGVIPSSAPDYFEFYRDLNHWKTWDENVEELEILEKQNENVQIVYWSVKYPFPLSSRDYVYRRYSKYYESHKIWVVACKLCEHEKKKPTSKRVRVTQYKLLQALRETPDGKCETFMEAYDDPQLSLPSWLVSWVTKTALPKFMNKLNAECTAYAAKRQQKK